MQTSPTVSARSYQEIFQDILQEYEEGKICEEMYYQGQIKACIYLKNLINQFYL